MMWETIITFLKGLLVLLISLIVLAIFASLNYYATIFILSDIAWKNFIAGFFWGIELGTICYYIGHYFEN